MPPLGSKFKKGGIGYAVFIGNWIHSLLPVPVRDWTLYQVGIPDGYTNGFWNLVYHRRIHCTEFQIRTSPWLWAWRILHRIILCFRISLTCTPGAEGSNRFCSSYRWYYRLRCNQTIHVPQIRKS